MKTKLNVITRLFLLCAMIVGGANVVWGTPNIIDGKNIISPWEAAATRYSNQNTVAIATYDDGFVGPAKSGSGYYVTYTWYSLGTSEAITYNNGDKMVINAKNSSSSGLAELVVRYSSDGSTFSNLADITTPLRSGGSAYSKYDELEVSLDNLTPGNDYYLQIIVKAVLINSAEIVSTGSGSSTPAPSAFSASNTQYNSVSLGWTERGTSTKWQIKYNAGSDFTPASEGTMASDKPVTTNPYTLSGLEAETTYYAYVRATPDGEDPSDWVGPLSFETPKEEPTSLTASDVTYSSAVLGWTENGGRTKWQIKYNEGSSFDPASAGTMASDDPVTTNPYVLSGLEPETTYYVYIRSYVDNETQGGWSDVLSFTTEERPVPTNFAVESYSTSTATLKWTAGSDETAWQIAYSTSSSFDPDSEGTKANVTTNPYMLKGLKLGTTYYARIRANYGGVYSAWTASNLTFTPAISMDYTVNDGTDSHRYIPIPNYTNNGTKTQFVIPSDRLVYMQNRRITKLTFYATTANIEWTDATFDVYMDEVEDYSAYDKKSPSFKDWGTQVATAKTLTVNSSKLMEITLDTPFDYSNGCLVIGFDQTTNTTSNTVTSEWYGVNEDDYTSADYYKGVVGDFTTECNKFSPKLTITSEQVTAIIGSTGWTTLASTKPLDLSNMIASEGTVTAYYASSINNTTNKVRMTSTTSTAVAAGEGIMLRGTSGAIITIPIASSDGSSIDGNLLVGCTSNTTLGTNSVEGYNNYVLVNNSGTAEFQSLADHGATIPGGKAYLQNGSYSEARALSIVFDDEEATGITDVRSKKEDVRGEYYDLQGRKVAQPTKGLYIVNGRKVVK